MIGNDVVDLRDPETRSGALHPRFDARVFTDDERRVLERSPTPCRTRWLLWAAKESAFKALRRDDGRVAFRPRDFAVTLAGRGGVVCHRVARVSFRVEATGAQALHVVAFGPHAPVDRLACGIAAVGGESPGSAARRMLIDAVARWLGASTGMLDVAQVDRVPYVRRDGVRLRIAVSLSHHGRFAAFACALPNRH
jgi:phosphopantetheinyl transferase (holo-ACP synthase)